MNIPSAFLKMKTVRIGLFLIGYVMLVYLLYYSISWEDFGIQFSVVGYDITAFVVITIVILITLLSHSLIQTAILGKFGIDL